MCEIFTAAISAVGIFATEICASENFVAEIFAVRNFHRWVFSPPGIFDAGNIRRREFVLARRADHYNFLPEILFGGSKVVKRTWEHCNVMHLRFTNQSIYLKGFEEMIFFLSDKDSDTLEIKRI